MFAGLLLASCVSTRTFACTEHVINDIATLVPGVVGETEIAARRCLELYGYSPQPGGEEPSSRPKGTVTRTDPQEATTPSSGDTAIPVTYWLSSGETEVPDVVGDSAQRAAARIERSGFTFGGKEDRREAGRPGVVIEQSPQGGTFAAQGTSVSVIVRAPLPEVPNVVGKDEKVAYDELAAEFEPALAGSEDGPQRADIVQRTNPEPGTAAEPRSRVAYWVSSGRNRVPDLRQHNTNQATEVLQDAGFGLGAAQERVDLGEPGTIVAQEPAADTIANVGDQVAVWVGKALVVPSIVDQSETDALQLLEAATLTGAKDGEESSRSPRGTVLSSDPVPGTRVMDHTAVRYRLASGKWPVPALDGMTKEEATRKLVSEGFTLGAIDTRPSRPYGVVLNQVPEANTLIDLQSPVAITISSEFPRVPNVVGKSRDDAESELKSKGLAPRHAADESSPLKRGTVLRTEPKAGTEADRLPFEVQYWAASGKNVVPGLIGSVPEAARGATTDAGFVLAEDITFEFAPLPSRVLKQSPAPGSLMPLGSAITVTLGSNRMIPDVRGRTVEEARAVIEGAGMTVGSLTERPSLGDDKVVLDQTPNGDVVVAPGAPVEIALTVSSSLLPPIIAGSVLIALLAGSGFTQVRPWPWHWAPSVATHVEFDALGDPSDDMPPPLPLAPVPDVRMRVEFTEGDAVWDGALHIDRVEIRHE
jgi:beta-lactam-binding protein with PASTA domain